MQENDKIPTINIYGLMTCSDTTDLLDHLKKKDIPFIFNDMNNKKNEKYVLNAVEMLTGKRERHCPVVRIGDDLKSKILIVPTIDEFEIAIFGTCKVET